MSKSAFLFIEVLQNSCQLYVKDKKWFLQTEQWYYLGAVRERITSARMHNWFLLNVSVSVWLLCFVLLVQETEMGLPKRHSMLQWLCRKLLFHLVTSLKQLVCLRFYNLGAPLQFPLQHCTFPPCLILEMLLHFTTIFLHCLLAPTLCWPWEFCPRPEIAEWPMQYGCEYQ